MHILLFSLFLIFATAAQAQTPPAVVRQPAQHGVAIQDAIEMTRISDEIVFSRDGTRFAAVVWRGDLETNRNLHSILAFDATSGKPIGPNPVATVPVGYALSDGGEPITNLTFFDGNGSIAFLAGKPGSPRQLYAVDVFSGEMRSLTRHPTDVLAYSLSDDGRTIMYAAVDRAEGRRRRFGFSILELDVNPPRASTVAGERRADAERVLPFEDGASEPRLLFGHDRLFSDTPKGDLKPGGGYLDDPGLYGRIVGGKSHFVVSPSGKQAVFWPYVPEEGEVALSGYDFPACRTLTMSLVVADQDASDLIALNRAPGTDVQSPSFGIESVRNHCSVRLRHLLWPVCSRSDGQAVWKKETKL